MKCLFFLLLLASSLPLRAQELYVYTEPASNVPARSVSAKALANYLTKQASADRLMQRYLAETQVGISRKWMLRAGTSFSDMYTQAFRWESVYAYGKFRFISLDESHRHFRMAAYAEASYSRNPPSFDEVSLTGDRSGVMAGIVATQLINRFAMSANVSHTQVLGSARHSAREDAAAPVSQVMNYSISAGYLLLPVEYRNYKQTNVNLYTEVLAQQSIDRGLYYIDLAPAVQLIFNSNTKLNAGYRFQVGSTMERMGKGSWLISVERTFLNVF